MGEQLTAAKVSFDYEGTRVAFTVPERKAKYLPDFRVGNIVIETKGYFGKGAAGRQKLLFVRDSNPHLDIRLIFGRATNKIYAGSTTTYADWADAHSFKWADKGRVPLEWIEDLRRETTKRNKKCV